MTDWLRHIAALARHGLREGMAPWLAVSLTLHAGMIAAILPEAAREKKWPDAGGAIAVDVVIVEGPDRQAAATTGDTEREARRPDRVRTAERTPATTPAQTKPDPTAHTRKPPEPTASAPPTPLPPAPEEGPAVPPVPADDAIVETSVRLAPPPRRKPEPPPAPTAPLAEAMETPAAAALKPTDEMAALPPAAAPAGGGSRGASPLPGNPKPVYPDGARRQGRQGRAILRVEVRPDGTAGAVSVDRSSGDDRLDTAAVAAVRQWRFRPALRNGAPVASNVRIPIRFRLQ